MAAKTVVDPQGRRWKVRRRWVHRGVSWRGPKGGRALDLVDGADLAGEGAELPVVGVIMFALAALLIAVLAVVFVVPALIFVLELLLVLVAVGLGALGRVLFRRPWTVEARVEGTNDGREWKVVGWRASGDRVASVAERLRATGHIGDVNWRP
ncbi:MAG: hypothetical protein KY439_08290 [Actinobacteria bacterium]|nr:hypothetical protein [Actinomycetota bacterium]